MASRVAEASILPKTSRLAQTPLKKQIFDYGMALYFCSLLRVLLFWYEIASNKVCEILPVGLLSKLLVRPKSFNIIRLGSPLT